MPTTPWGNDRDPNGIDGPVGYLGFEEQLRIVKYRERSARIECQRCRFRFTVDFESMATTLERAGALAEWSELRRYLP